MVARIFKNKEREYQRWLRANPSGYVLTTVRDISPTYMSLHRADCRMISQYMKGMGQDAFTGQRYIKICSTHPEELRAWIKSQGGRDFTKLCSICAPEVRRDVKQSVERYLAQLEQQVARSRRDPQSRRKRLALAPKKPESFAAITIIFKRNADVIAEVIERAAGTCEACGNKAPFCRVSDGSPYLEVHHKVLLAEGGDDTVDNAVAICPNCHRKAHYG